MRNRTHMWARVGVGVNEDPHAVGYADADAYLSVVDNVHSCTQLYVDIAFGVGVDADTGVYIDVAIAAHVCDDAVAVRRCWR